MHPYVGPEFSGAALIPANDPASATGTLGWPVWGPEQFLRDLELRLGLSRSQHDHPALRITRWAARMALLAPQGRFYSHSYEVDPLGTARSVLDLRDALIESDWNGSIIANGGPRLEAIAELEALPSPTLPMGFADRLAAVRREHEACGTQLYAELTLADQTSSWSALWQRVFEGLQRTGTVLSTLHADLPGAPRDSDLGIVQRALANENSATLTPLRGDGTFVVLVTETSLEAAAASAALLASEHSKDAVVVRAGNDPALDRALTQQGLAAQGLQSSSRWRSALQVLPLALELAFEPKDPFRVLDLLTLPRGPFRGANRRRLLRALARSPGIGGRAWEEAKERFLEPREETLARVAEWLEVPGAQPSTGATKNDLLEVIARVRSWLTAQLFHGPDDATILAALGQCDHLTDALAADARSHFDLVNLRRLTELVAGNGVWLELTAEQAGRIAHVSSPESLWVSKRTVLWWSFTHAYEGARRLPWRRQELAALSAAGVTLADPRERLMERALGYRRAIQAATERVILIAPRTTAGHKVAPHPLWDEIAARLDLQTTDIERVTRSAYDLLGSNAREPVAVLELPVQHQTWNVTLDDPVMIGPASAASISSMLGCPLQWALSSWAGLDSEGAGLPATHLLNGTLGHRLIEELHVAGAFEDASVKFRARAELLVDGLIAREGAVLLRPGKAHERDQLRKQLVDAACTLRRTLTDNTLELIGAEQVFEIPWRATTLRGRWDLLARDPSGRHVVIDLKWGDTKYRTKLRKADDVQLPAYEYALRSERAEAAAVYFSLASRKLFGLADPSLPELEVVQGPSLTHTWQRVERTVEIVENELRKGRIHVTGVHRSLPLLDSLGVPGEQQPHHFSLTPEQACEYCNFDVLCGQRWAGAQ